MKTSEEGGRAAQAPGLLRTTGARPPAQRFGAPSSEPREDVAVITAASFTNNEAWSIGRGLGNALRSAFLSPDPALPHERCMCRGCPRKAAVQLVAIGSDLAAHEHPPQVCERCLNRGVCVDIFRWLSNNRIETDR